MKIKMLFRAAHPDHGVLQPDQEYELPPDFAKTLIQAEAATVVNRPAPAPLETTEAKPTPETTEAIPAETPTPAEPETRDESPEPQQETPDPLAPLAEQGIENKTLELLREAGVASLADLVAFGDLTKINGIGRKTADALAEAYAAATE